MICMALASVHFFSQVGVPQPQILGPKKKDSCVQVSEVKKIRVGRSKNIFILDFFLLEMCRGSGGELL